MTLTLSLRVTTVVVLLSAAACPLPLDDAPIFGAPCDGECPDGYFCDADANVCLPGTPPEPPPPPPSAVIDTFVVAADDVRDDEDVTLTWTTTDADGCALSDGDDIEGGPLDVAVVEVDGALTLRLPPGDHTAQLSCVGPDGVAVESDVVRVHVRRVATGTLTLATQDDVEDSATVEEVDGDLLIVDSAATDLAPLTVKVVHGFVSIVRASSLSGDLTLSALERVDGSLFVDELLVTEVIFPELVSVGEAPGVDDTGTFSVGKCDQLETLSVPKLETVGGDVAWSTYRYPDFPNSIDNPSPATLEALTELEAPELRTIGGSLDIEDARALPTLNFPALEAVGGTIVLYGLSSIRNILLPELRTSGSIILDANARGLDVADTVLTVDLSALTAVSAVDDDLGKINELSYDVLVGRGFFRVGGVVMVRNAPVTDDIGDNSNITSLDLSALTTVEGALELRGLGVQSLDFAALERVGGDLVIIDNTAQTSPFALPELEEVGGELLANDDLAGLDRLVSVGDDFTVVPFAQRLPEMTSLTTIGGTAFLNEWDAGEVATLTALASVGRLSVTSGGPSRIELPALTTAGTLDLTSNDITELELCSLTTVSLLNLTGTRVSTLNGLAALRTAQTLRVRNNGQLPQCRVDALQDQLDVPAGVFEATGNATPDPCLLDTTPVCSSP